MEHAAEGVIKFSLHYQAADPPDWALCAELDAWRTLLFQLGLTGQNPMRYGGLGYGNVSRRLDPTRFLISGSQTGGRLQLRARDYCVVNGFSVSTNRIDATGPIKPSSEALTHGGIYADYPTMNCVLHVHSPLIWSNAAALGMPVTPNDIAYGTPEMARSISQQICGHLNPVIVMGGHEDGVIACGTSIEDAALALISSLARALRQARSG